MLSWGNLGLLLHIIGIVILSGGLIGGVILHYSIWNTLKTSPVQAAGIGRVSQWFSIFPPVGAILLLLSGLLILVAQNWAYWGQWWLTVKLVLFGLLFLNGVLVAKPNSDRLEKLLPQWLVVNGGIPSLLVASYEQGGLGTTATKAEVEAELSEVRQRFTFFHISENLMFLAVLVLATFKFS